MHQYPGEQGNESLSTQLLQLPEAQAHPELIQDFANTLASHAQPNDSMLKLAQVILSTVDPQRSFNHLIRYLEAQPSQQPFWRAFQQHPDTIAYIVNVLAASQYLSHILLRRPELLYWLLDGALLTPLPSTANLTEQLLSELHQQETEAEMAASLRAFTYQNLLRIGARDLNRLADIETITADLSSLAECVIQSALQICHAQLDATYGAPLFVDDDGAEHPCHFCVIGMGKLGGRELNFSSDIDLMYVYTSYQGQTRGIIREGEIHNQISNHEYFVHLARRLTNMVGGKGPEGQAFRVDLRLRPEGTQGQLALSLLSYEAYYARLGQTWEKMALIKARPVAGPAALGDEFIALIEPFVYQRHLDPEGVRQIRSIKQQIDLQIADKEQSRTNVKLGLGGIREIEFFIQILQLLFAGRQPVLKERHSLRALTLLREAGLITPQVESTLRDNYCYLRDLEHRLQMEQGAQTHRLPHSPEQQRRIARLCGFPTWNDFYQDYLLRTETVHQIFSSAYDNASTLSETNFDSSDPSS
jgi:glutamate-ammonia-ligase adenylyltransferase